MERGRTWRAAGLLTAIGLVAAACSGSDEPVEAGTETEEATGDVVADGEYCAGGADRTLTWVHEQEPPDMHLDDPNNNLSITSYIHQALWDGLWGEASDLSFFPELLAEDPEVELHDDGSVTYRHRLREGLTWSDGEPLDADDVRFTFDVIMEGFDPEAGGGVYLLGSRQGYDRITDLVVESATEFTIEASSFFSGYKTLFVRVFPEHAFGDGATAADVNEALKEWTGPDGEFLPSSGPMVYTGREPGVSMTLVRNETYHGNVSPEATNRGLACVNGVEIRWVPDTDAQINALKAGEADFIFTQPQVEFGQQIVTDDDFTQASRPGPVFEHWGFNLLNPHLAKTEVREAIAYALDKQQVVQTLYSPLYGDALSSEGLGNTYWMTNQAQYEDHQAEYAGAQIEPARERLEAAGYAAGSDGIYAHPEDGRLSLRVGTTGGNKLRELQQQIVIEQLSQAGIEVTIDNVPGSDYFSTVVFSAEALAASTSLGAEGDPTKWDITQFAWVGGPWPGGQNAAYLSTSGINPYAYQNAAFDEQAAVCDRAADEAELGDCFNELDRFVTQVQGDGSGLAVLPLTQKPQFFAYSNTRLQRAPIAPDTNNAGPIVNVVDYLPAP